MRQKDASETEGEGIQNSDQASNAIWGRNVGYNEDTKKRIEVTETRMLRWMCRVTCKDKIRNEHIRGTAIVAQASKKITERRLIWYGHVMRRDGEHILRKVLRADIPGKRKRGRPKTRWKDACQRDLKKYWTESGRGDGQGDVEKKHHQSYRRSYSMGKARGKVSKK